jgi:hypothetical protein
MLLEKLMMAQQVKKFLSFNGNPRFLDCSQEPTTGHYTEPDEYSPYPHDLFNIYFNIVLSSTPTSPS